MDWEKYELFSETNSISYDLECYLDDVVTFIGMMQNQDQKAYLLGVALKKIQGAVKEELRKLTDKRWKTWKER